MKTYDFKQKDAETKEATQEIIKWLEDKGYTVKNVEKDKAWQEFDVDLLVFIPNENGHKLMYMIEVKIDKYYRTGNVFFETNSCVESQSPGCFMYTKSNYIFYYFYPDRQLYIIPTHEAREWFIKNKDRFKIRQTSSYRYNGDIYHTEGKLVPRKMLVEETSAYVEDLSNYF